MILPTEKDYDGFVREFSEEISKRWDDVCFYLYGSYVRKDMNPRRSDVDGGIILNDNFVTDKGKVMQIAEIFKTNVLKFRIEPQFNLSDRGSNKDGRFISYTKDFTDWFEKAGKVICGPDYLREIKGLDFKSGMVSSTAFNLRRIRNNLMEFLTKLEKTPEEIGKGLKKGAESLVNLTKKILYLEDGKLYDLRVECVEEFKRRYSGLDFSTLDEINRLLGEPKEFMGILFGEDFSLKLSLSREVLTAYEQILKAYVKKFPQVSEKEARG